MDVIANTLFGSHGSFETLISADQVIIHVYECFVDLQMGWV